MIDMNNDAKKPLSPTPLAGLLALAFALPAAAQLDPVEAIKRMGAASAAARASSASAPKPARAKKPATVAKAAPAQAGFAAADAAYKAYDRRDYAAAASQAEEAVRQQPANRDWWALLVNALVAAGRHAEAEQALARATQAVGGESMAAVRDGLKRAQAQAAGEQMYKALQAGDVARGIAMARTAVGHAPEHPGYRMVLVYALLRGQQFAEAEQVASETVALVPESAAPLTLRAYARQRLGRWPEARADLDRALQQRGVPAAAQGQLRLIAADAALAAGEPQRALELLKDAPATDAAAQERRLLAQQLGATGRTGGYPVPSIDCSNVEAAQACLLRAGAAPQDPGYLAAAEAYKAVQAKDEEAALRHARQAAAASPGNRDYQLLLMDTARTARQWPEAQAAATAALALRADDAQVLAQRSAIRRQAGDAAGADADAQAALAAGGLGPAQEATLLADLGRRGDARRRLAEAGAAGTLQPGQALDLGYLHARIGDDRAAVAAYAQADAGGGLPPSALQDAGYAAMRAGQDDAAIAYFKRSVDAAEALQLKMTPQMLFDTRRTISEVSRRWGVLASLTWREGGGTEPTFGLTSGTPGNKVLQAGAEAYWRPWGFRNGRFVELFLRGFETLHSEAGGATGGDSFAGALGVRWKPFTQHNAVLSFSRVFGSGTSSDWLAQAAYSFDRGSDLRLDVPSWWTTRIAAEAGRYLEAEQTYGLASLMLGRSWRLGGEDARTVLFAHGVLAGEYNSSFAEKTAFGVGPGVSVRHWFREDKYHAPRSYWDLTMQYRVPVGGDDRLKGLYVNTLVSY